VLSDGGAFDPNTGNANIPGCIALVTGDASPMSCAAAENNAWTCTSEACGFCGTDPEYEHCLTTVSSDAGDCHDVVAAQCDPNAGGFALCVFDYGKTDPVAWAKPFTAVFCANDLDASSDAADDALDGGTADAD
jgi:hypothetical protein